MRNIIPSGWWMIKVDISDYYLHFGLEEEEQAMWGIKWGGEFYVFMAAVFGFTALAQVASRVSKEVMSVLRREGMSGMVWIDNFLFAFRIREEAEIGGKKVVERLKGLGFVVNKEKCVLVPRQRMEYIGFMIDSVKKELGLSEKRVKKTREVIEEV